MLRLAGKVVLVTGGTRGIGRGIARAFLAEGARVAYSGTSPRSVEAARAALPGCEGIVAELGEPDAPQRLVEEVLRRLGGIDILVNNAGVVSRASEWDLTPEEGDRLHAVNLRAAFFAAREAARSMRDRGGGSIVNVASIAGQNGGIAGSPASASSKAALIGLTKSLARRFAPHAIRVNCLSPADIETDMTASWPQELRARLTAITPLGRFGTVDEVTGAALFLAGAEASYITGQILAVNGGAYM